MNKFNEFCDYLSVIAEAYWYDYVKRPIFKTKMFFQRATRGWCDEDSWNVDSWLSRVVPPVLTKLANDAHGYPSNINEILDEYEHRQNDIVEPKITKSRTDEEKAQGWKNLILDIAKKIENYSKTSNDLNPYKYTHRCHFEEKNENGNTLYLMVDECTPEEQEENQKAIEWDNAFDERKMKDMQVGLSMLAKYFMNLWD